MKTFLFWVIGIFQWVCVQAQSVLHTDAFSYDCTAQSLDIHFDKNLPEVAWMQATDAFSGALLPIEIKGPRELRIANLHPAQLVQLTYTYNQQPQVFKSETLATLSASTGAMKVFFNHPVDTSFATTQQAVNLGNTLDSQLITYINACQQTLDIAIYSSYSPSATTGIAGAINAAYTRGVQVRIIYDGSASSLISLLNTNIPTLASPQGSNYTIMHNKFVIFDANHTDASVPHVWTGSTNWTTAQIDGPDKNNVIDIQDQALALGYTLEFEEMWGGSAATPNLTNSRFGQFKTNNTPHQYTIGGKQVNQYFSPTDLTTTRIIQTINTAQSDLSIAVMNLTRSDITSAITGRYTSGVSPLGVLIDSSNPSGNQLTALQTAMPSALTEVYQLSGIMHHKFMVVDNFNPNSDPQVLTGSHNWSTAAETKNDENTVIVHDANIANQYFQAYAYLYQQAGGVILNAAAPNMPQQVLFLFPNPTSNSLHISGLEEADVQGASCRVYNALGALVTQWVVNQADTALDVSALPTGCYSVHIQTHAGLYVSKFIKK